MTIGEMRALELWRADGRRYGEGILKATCDMLNHINAPLDHINATLALCAASMPVLADTLPGHPELSVTQQDGHVVAVVTLDNFPGGVPGQHRVVIETRLGPVTLLHTVTANAPRGCCADFLEVTDGPAGTVAYPWRIEVAESATGTIEIREWSGM